MSPPNPQGARVAEGKVFDPENIVQFSTMKERGEKILAEGISYVVERLIPNYGFVGFLVGLTKIGKSTFGMTLVRHILTGTDFLGMKTKKTKVLYLAIEDPEEYLCVLVAQSMGASEENGGTALMYPRPLVFNKETLEAIAKYIEAEGVGLVYIATFLAGVRDLVKDENDNVGMSKVVGNLKALARRVKIPVLIESHTGKAESADPAKALRGASGASGEADFLLLLQRYGRSHTKRILSGLGRFVELDSIVLDYDLTSREFKFLQVKDDEKDDWKDVEAVLSRTEYKTISKIATETFTNNEGGRTRVRRAIESNEHLLDVKEDGKGKKVRLKPDRGDSGG